MSIRGYVRAWLPFEIRWRVKLASRLLADRRHATRFARRATDATAFALQLSSYALELRCYPGQERQFEGKLHNVGLSLSAIDYMLLRPGDTFSFWRCVGRPTASRGYATAAALRGGQLITESGGSICLTSTLLYNVGLLSGLTVVERHAHSVDTYGSDRYFELGRDASVEFAYRDLRMRNDLSAPVLLRCFVRGQDAHAESWADRNPDLSVALTVCGSDSRPEPGTIAVQTIRTISERGSVRSERLGESRYIVPT